MTDYIVAYKTYLLNVKRSSSNTVDSYIRDVNQYSEYCTSLGKSADKMSSDDFHGYLDYLTALGKSEATKTRILASLRCFYKFMLSEGYSETNPTEAVKIKRTEKKLPGILDSNEIMLLLSQPDGTDYKSRRDKAMLELLYATGIKVSELIELTVSNVNLQIGILHLHNDKKERIVPMYPAAVKAVSSYLLNVRPVIVTDEAEDRLFTKGAISGL